MKKDALHGSWFPVLEKEFDQPYFLQLVARIKEDIAQGKRIYPRGSDFFAAFQRTPFDKVSVVILGQDPYHGEGQAHGLAFSVPQGVAVPPSLKNIFLEIQNDLGETRPFPHGDLTSWAEQGVLLLNTSLSVLAGQPMSHAQIGWHLFTDEVIRILSRAREHLVFLLWGKPAEAKRHLIDERKHLVLTAPHPSPLSAHRGFFGCHHFSKTNAYLAQHHQPPIVWTNV